MNTFEIPSIKEQQPEMIPSETKPEIAVINNALRELDDEEQEERERKREIDRRKKPLH